MSKKSTPAPKGLSIKRSGENFICSWRPGGNNYDKQEAEYRADFNGTKKYTAWTKCSVTKSSTEFAIKWKKEYDLDHIQFRVRAKNKGKNYPWSSWTEQTYNIKPPNKPSATVSYVSDYNDATVVFAWAVTATEDSPHWFYRVGWRTRLVNNNSDTKPDWSDIVYSQNASGSFTQYDDSSVVYGADFFKATDVTADNFSTKKSELYYRAYVSAANTSYVSGRTYYTYSDSSYSKDSSVTASNFASKKANLYYLDYVSAASSSYSDRNYYYRVEGEASYTREFQIVSFGPGGANPKDRFADKSNKNGTKPVTVKHVYAKPYTPKDVEAEIEENGTSGYLCYVDWDSHATLKHPIDSQELQYLVCVPRMVDEVVDNVTEKRISVPTGTLSWQTAAVFFANQKDSKFTNRGSIKDGTNKKPTRIKLKKKKRLKRTTTSKTKRKVTIPQDTGTAESCYFTIDQLLEDDTVVFVRLVSKRDSSTLDTQSAPVLCDDGDIYHLAKPTGVSIELSPTNNAQNRLAVTATNNSTVPDSILIVSYMEKDKPETIVDIGVITANDNGSKVIEIPNDASSYSIGVRAALGKVLTPTRDTAKAYDKYEFSDESNVFIESEKVWVEGEAIPSPPKNVVLSHNELGIIHVEWDWDWREAESAELSWSDYKDAWTSTAEPSYFSISNLYDGNWNIADCELGVKYYARIRLMKQHEDTVLTSRWSEPASIFLSASPATPRLEVSPSYINPGGKFNATWTYITTDNTAQKNAEVALFNSSPATNANKVKKLGDATTQQSIPIDTSEFGWTAGSVKQLAVQVVSESNSTSEWSPTVDLNVIAPLTCSITMDANDGFVSTTKTISVLDDETQQLVETTITYPNTLTHLPLKFTVGGAGANGKVTVTIERFGEFRQPGPDENEFVGYDGEIVYSRTYYGSSQLSIVRNDPFLIGSLDEGAKYKLRAVISDDYGQTAELNKTNDDSGMTFIVNWDHDATIPTAELSYILDEYGEIGAKIDASETTVSDNDDVMDIYRLSADKPQLICYGGSFATSYVDPYPTIGDFGGYIVVYRTKYDDYVTSNGGYAWTYLDADNSPMFDIPYSVINFGGDEVFLEYNINLSSSWNKEFTETKYLGGSIQGDWNPAISRTGTINTSVITSDVNTIKAMRRLAAYSGVCQIRTYDGSNYKANINVTEQTAYQNYYDPDGNNVYIVTYDLSITRVDADYLDAVTEADWTAQA